jgi:hypothetical protein
MTRVNGGVALFLSCVVIACTGSNENSETLDMLPELNLVEELRIGSANDPNVGFSRIGPVAVDSDGSIYLFEYVDSHIRAYNRDGALVRTIGRRGDGPGEFNSGATVGLLGDTLWAMSDGGGGCQRKLTLFTKTGEFLSTANFRGVRMQLQSGIGVVAPRLMRSDGRFVGDQTCYTGGEPDVPAVVAAGDTVRIPRILFALDGTVLDTLAWEPRPPNPPSPARESIMIEGRNHPVPQPPTDAPLTVALVDGRLVVDRARPTTDVEAVVRITRTDFAGDTVYSVRHRYTPQRYTDGALDMVASSSASVPGGAYRLVNGMPLITPYEKPGIAAQLIRDKLAFPEFQTPVRSSAMGEDGSIWLMREDTGGETYRWNIFDSRGQARGWIDLPRMFRMAWTDGATVLAVLPDENDVPWLLRYRLAGMER